MTIVRSQGQLSEEDDASTQDLAKLQGVPITPTSPAGTAALGANPDQAKMAGTPAQKAAAGSADAAPLQDASGPQDTLSAAQRTDAGQQKATADEEASQQKAAQLQSLGSLQTRVQALINKDLALKNPVAAQVDTSTTGNLAAVLSSEPQLQAQAQQLLQKIAANPNDANATAAAAQFWVDNQLGTIDTFSPDKFMASTQQALSASAQSQVQAGGATLEAVGLTDAEGANLQAVFGDDYKKFTVPQLSQKIEEMRQAEFNRVGGIKAQLATATGAQRQALIAELTDAGQQGVTGTEQTVKTLSDAVQHGDTVTIGGEEHKVSDLMKDDQISDLVKRMLNDPALAGKVAASNPEFAAWVKSNADGLKQISDQAATTMGTVRNINVDKQKLAQAGNTTLSPSVMEKLVPGFSKISGTAPDTHNSSVLSYLKTLDPGTATSFANALNGITNPAILDQIKDTPDGGKIAWEDAQSLAADPTGLLNSIVGKTGAFVLDPTQQKQIAAYKGVADSIAKYPNLSSVYTGHLEDLKAMVMHGTFTAQTAAALASTPDPNKTFQSYLDYHQKIQDLHKAGATGDINGVLTAIFGKATDASQLNDQYKNAKSIAADDPTNTQALSVANALKSLDTNNDGVLDAKDASALSTKMGDTSLMDMISKGTPVNTLGDMMKKANLDVPVAASADMNDINAMTADSVYSANSYPTQLTKLSAAQLKAKGLPTAAQFKAHQDQDVLNKRGSDAKDRVMASISTNLGGDWETRLGNLDNQIKSGQYIAPKDSQALGAAIKALGDYLYPLKQGTPEYDVVNAWYARLADVNARNTKLYLDSQSADKAKSDQAAAAAKAKSDQAVIASRRHND